jgi:hypothetical protein
MTADKQECPRCKLFPRPHTCVPDLKVPTIHLNGTGGPGLFEQIKTAVDTAAAAIKAHVAAAPHGRDYYVQNPNAYGAARAQWENRQGKLEGVHAELTYLMHEIYDALSERDRESL